MKNCKKIDDWKYILLDTSFIIDYLSDPERFNNNSKKKENIEISKKDHGIIVDEKQKGKATVLCNFHYGRRIKKA
jgi:AMMECR1 domain-containing protein